ncbi:Transglycosylase SLT domain protein [Legionella birminghamensis]|uniref:Protein ipgF n=1 Tax=Legionella birminghamensis TaxID=28083 RepID=A0A378JQP3_9GAMM|nr:MULTISPECIES: hypothetical protein [Legionella]KTC71800.1 Transglycosylase SLT domain protein [Legionella birminghamensis]MCW8452560.1 conjugal transfer protein TrbN [Legionella quinlivanii]STX60844.1 Protein ipgF [Legionella birminghamensis]
MPIPVDFSIIHQERIACSIMASIKYQVPTNILLALAEKEGGRPNQWSKNRNGTYDVGSMQLNTVYLRDLAKYGIKPSDVARPGCYAYDLAAWRVRKHLLHDSQDIWTRAANYHSKTPHYNQIYRADLIKKAMKWQQWLNQYFNTHGVNSPAASPVTIQQTRQVLYHDAVQVKRELPTPRRVSSSYHNKEAERALASVFAPERMGELT